MAVYFTSDTHFGHAAGRGYLRRPFASVAEMDAAMVENWNARVGPDDEVWHLGDLAIGWDRVRTAALLDRLAGRKHLVAGNNDPASTTDQPHWASVQAYAEIEVDGVTLVLCHYPFRTWNGMSKGALNLHGHSHGRLAPLPRQVDVGVDVWDFRPVALAEIRARRRRKTLTQGG